MTRSEWKAADKHHGRLVQYMPEIHDVIRSVMDKDGRVCPGALKAISRNGEWRAAGEAYKAWIDEKLRQARMGTKEKAGAIEGSLCDDRKSPLELWL